LTGYTPVISATDGTSTGKISVAYGYVVGQVYYDAEVSLAGWEVQRLQLDPSDDAVIGVIDTTYTNADGYFAFPQYTGTATAVEVVPYAPSGVASDWDTSADMAFSFDADPQGFSDDVFIPTAVATYIPTSVEIVPADAGVVDSNDPAAADNVATVGTGQEEQFTAVELDQYGNPLATQPTFTWSSPGTVDSSTGVFTADGSVGTSSITATDGATGLASTMDVDEIAPAISEGASAATASSSTIALSVLGSDPSDAIDPPNSSLTYTWSVTSEPTGASTSFSDNGDDTANSIVCSVSTTGTYDFSVVVSNGTTSVTDTTSLDLTADPSWLDPGSAAAWDASTHTLTVNGLATIASDPGSDEPNIVADGPDAQVVVEPTTSDSLVHIGGLTLTDGAGLTMVSVGDSAGDANHNVLAVGTAGGSSDPTFSIDSLSFLDLENNDLIVHTGSSDTTGADLTAIQSLADTGSDSGAWDGNGLTSSTAAGVNYTAGYQLNSLNVYENGGSMSAWTIGSASETLGTDDVIVSYNALPAGVTSSSAATYTYNPSTNTLVLTDGTLTFNDVGTSSSLTLNVVASGSSSSLVFDTTTYLNSLTLINGASATLALSGTDTVDDGELTSYGTTLSDANTKALVLNNLSIPVEGATLTGGGTNSAQGTLDLTDNAMILNYTGSGSTALSASEALVASAFDGDEWDGTGLTSSEVAADSEADNNTAIGIGDNGVMGFNTFAGQDVSSHQQLLFMFTWNGDSNLDGKVTSADYALMQSGWPAGYGGPTGGPAGYGWQFGLYDYGLYSQTSSPGVSFDEELYSTGNGGYAANGAINISES
jgi:hypothetical protein